MITLFLVITRRTKAVWGGLGLDVGLFRGHGRAFESRFGPFLHFWAIFWAILAWIWVISGVEPWIWSISGGPRIQFRAILGHFGWFSEVGGLDLVHFWWSGLGFDPFLGILDKSWAISGGRSLDLDHSWWSWPGFGPFLGLGSSLKVLWSYHFLLGGGPSVCGGTRNLVWSRGAVCLVGQWGGQKFFMDAKGGPEKIGDWPSQTDGPPLPVKKW